VLALPELKQRCAYAETRIEDKHSALVMIRTILNPRQRGTRRSVGVDAARPSLARLTRPLMAPSVARRVSSASSEQGDTLIEVVVSAALIAFVVVAVLFGLDSTNRVTALDRARSQADALAQQSEEKLRSEPVRKISGLEHEETVTVGKTAFVVKTTSEYVQDTTGTSSCTSSSTKADYLKTISKVTWPSMGNTKAVEETGDISPPPDSDLIVQVEESGSPLSKAKVVATGPSPSTSEYELETSSDGCAIFAVSPGEYSINVSKAGYVDPNGYAETIKDPTGTHTVYLPAETTSKEGYNLGRAGKLKISFTDPEEATPEGDSVVIYNTGMTIPRRFPEIPSIGTYKPIIETPNTIFPFPTTPPTNYNYTVYAGSCEANLPTRNGQGSNPGATVVPGEVAEAKVALPPINIKVVEGSNGQLPEKPFQGATVRLEDSGCGTVRELTTTSAGALSHPGMPFGTYSLCVTATVAGVSRKYTQSVVDNNENGVTEPTIYLGEAETKSGCP
jgi:Tfp pilus assembly protein PilV